MKGQGEGQVHCDRSREMRGKEAGPLRGRQLVLLGGTPPLSKREAAHHHQDQKQPASPPARQPAPSPARPGKEQDPHQVDRCVWADTHTRGGPSTRPLGALQEGPPILLEPCACSRSKAEPEVSLPAGSSNWCVASARRVGWAGGSEIRACVRAHSHTHHHAPTASPRTNSVAGAAAGVRKLQGSGTPAPPATDHSHPWPSGCDGKGRGGGIGLGMGRAGMGWG